MTFGNCADFYPLLTSCYSLLSSKGLDIGIGRGCSSTIRCCNSSSSISIDGLFDFLFLNLFPPKSFNFSLNLLFFASFLSLFKQLTHDPYQDEKISENKKME